MRIISNDIKMIHVFFKIKKMDHYDRYRNMLNDFAMKPGLYYLSQKYKIDVEQVYEIIRVHDINKLNMNIINILES